MVEYIKKNIKILTLIVFVMSALSCREEQTGNAGLLNEAAQILEKEPNRAADMLKAVKPELLNNNDFAWFSLLQARAWNALGKDISSLEADILEIKDYFILSNNTEKAAYASFVLAQLYYKGGNSNKALYNFLQSDEWAAKSSFRIFGLSYSLIPYNIAVFYFTNGNYDESLDYSDRALKYYDAGKEDYTDILYIYELKSIIYEKKDMRDSAMYYYNEAMKLAEQYNDTDSKIRIFHNLTRFYSKLGDYELAEQKCLETISLLTDNDSIKIGTRYISLAVIYNETDRKDLGLSTLYKAENLLKNADFSLKVPLYEILYYTEKERGNIKEAEYCKKQMEFYKNLSDNFYKKLEEEVKQLQKENIAEVKQANLTRIELAKSKNSMCTVLFSVASLFLLCSLVFFIRYRNSRKERKKLLLEAHNKINEVKVNLNEKAEEDFNKKLERKIKEFELKYDKINKKLKEKSAEYKGAIEKVQKEKEEEINRIQEKQTKEYNAKYHSLKKVYRAEIIKYIFKKRDLQQIKELLENIDICSDKVQKAKEKLNDVTRRMNWYDLEPMLETNYEEVFSSLREKFPAFTELEYRYACMVVTKLFSETEIMNLMQITSENLKTLKQSVNRKLGTAGYNFYYLEDYIEIQKERQRLDGNAYKRQPIFS